MSEINDVENQESEQSLSPFNIFINKMCSAQNWKITESDPEHAVIQFAVDETRTQTLFVFGFDNSLEFSVPSFAAFDSLENVPHLISSTLLQINAKTKLGFWCLEHIGERFVYTFMHNADLSSVDEIVFKEIVTTLIQRVNEFENLLENMAKDGTSKTETVQ